MARNRVQCMKKRRSIFRDGGEVTEDVNFGTCINTSGKLDLRDV